MTSARANIVEPLPEVIGALKARYREPQRAYHTWEHIEALLRHFDAHRELVSDGTAVLWAIYWHDAIYDPRASDNEQKSMEAFRQTAMDVLDHQSVESVSAMILATVKHDLPNGDATWRKDCGVFLDFDLSILAAPAPVFDQYEANVRKEYAFVAEEFFRTGRKAILERFLQRPALYFTAVLRDLWEEKARENVKRSIEALTH